jgi:hypothetical protein
MLAKVVRGLLIGVTLGGVTCEAVARDLDSHVEELDRIPAVRTEYSVPNEHNMLFYIQRSANSNTVVYAARLDGQDHIDPDTPVDAYWRLFNIDGNTRPLNFVERLLAYGVKSVSHARQGGAITFKIAALPERQLTLAEDGEGHPEALTSFGNRTVRLIYVYLQVDDSGLTPSVTALDLFGLEQGTGKALREHVIPR